MQVIKVKKRRLGRVQKIIGDYFLLVGLFVDVNVYYFIVLEFVSLIGDYFWYVVFWKVVFVFYW